MAVNTYECLFLLDPNKASSDWEGVMGRVNGIVERNGGEILATRPWGEPKLCYVIKKFRKGSYLLTYFKSEPAAIAAMEREARLDDVILRHMVLKLHPHIAKEILAHFQDAQPEAAAATADASK